MRSGYTRIPSTTPHHQVLHVVEQRGRVRQRDALDRRVRDVALVPQRHVLEARLRVAAQQPGEAGDALARDRVALVRHRAGALLPLARTAPRPRAPRCAAGGGPPSPAARARRRRARSRVSTSAWRSRGTTCVETSSARRPSRSSVARSTSGPSAEYVPTAPESLPTSASANARRRRSAARRLSHAKPASFTPKVVGSACTPCVRPMHSVSANSRARRDEHGRQRIRAGRAARARPRAAAARAPCRARRRT